ncbi:phage tail protein [Collinsella stercoris]|uniref:phage tail protein n=1 Tax=Collinsella stercoris TaxID=147206 RepID=UPI003AF0E545
MATELATAYLSLIPTLRGAGKSIQNELDGINVDPSGKKMGKQLGDGLTDGAKSGSSGIMSALGGIAKVAGPALAAIGFSQLVGEAAAATDATQKFKSTLDFAGLGTSEIDALSKSTRKYADDTVYALSDIQNITAQLAANSVPNYDKLAEAAGNLNAVAGGNAETFESVGMVLTQTAGAGKLTAENWNQLADAIPGASGKLQEAMLKNGAYTGNFRKAMEQGQISAEEFNQAIMQLGFEDAAVKAAKSTETFEGAMGNLQAAAVGGISDLLAKLQPAITGVMNGLVPVVEGAFGSISAAAGFVVDNIGLIAPAVAAVSAAFAVLAANPIAIVVTAVAALAAGFIALYNSNEQFRNAANALFAQLTTIFGPALQQIGAMVTNLVTVIASTVGPVLANITAMVMSAMPAIQNAISVALSAIGAIWNAIWPTLSALVGYVFSTIQTVVSTVLGVIQGIIQVVTSAIQGDWSGVWEGIKAIASSVWEDIKSTVTNGINTAKSIINSVLNAISSMWSGAWNALGGFLNGAWNSFVETVSGGNERVMGLLRDLPGKITSLFSGAGSWLINAGKSIINGLLDGLKNAWGNVTGFIGGIGDWIVSHKGPPSYDAVMLTKNGELIMRGLLDGMISGWGDVEDFIGSRNASISASYAVSPTYSPRDFTPSASGDGSAVIEWLERNLGDIISDRTPVMGSRDFARMSRRAVGYGI